MPAARTGYVTQNLEGARHVKTYAKLLNEKVQPPYPINASMQALIADTLNDSHWEASTGRVSGSNLGAGRHARTASAGPEISSPKSFGSHPAAIVALLDRKPAPSARARSIAQSLPSGENPAGNKI